MARHVVKCSVVKRLTSFQGIVKIELATVDIFVFKSSTVIVLIPIRQKTGCMIGVLVSFMQEVENMP